MVQSKTTEPVVPSEGHQKSNKPMKNVRISKSSTKTLTPTSAPHPACEATSVIKEKDSEEEHNESNEVKKEDPVVRTVTTAVEDIKRRRREERLAKEKQAEEERERFVKEATEKKAAERAEIIKQAKRLILYRKPMCRRINQGLIASECFRELDAQLKFREIIKNADKEAEIAYVKALRADVEKYEEEMKQKAEKQLEKKRNYSVALKKQIEEMEKAAKEEETKEFEAQKQDQLNMTKYLSDAKEFEMQKLLTKKQKLNQFFKDAIEEKKQLNLKLKHEDAFEDRAIEIYKQAKARIAKAYKEVKLKENKERERRADFTAEKFRTLTQGKGDIEERNYKKAVEEQEAQFQEKEKNRKERALRLKKEIHDFKKETENAKSKFLQEEKDWKTWELMQRFKRAEYDKELDAEERKRARDKKMEYAKSLKKYISEREVAREQEKLAEDKAMDMTEIINKENKKVLDYAEEVLNESKDVRPLLPILKAVDDCKREMGLLPLKKREATIAEAKRKKRRIPRVCTKFVPEDKICYLN